MRIIFEKADLLKILSKELDTAVEDLVVLQTDPLEVELRGVAYNPDREMPEKVVQAPAPAFVPPAAAEPDDGVSPAALLKRSRNLMQELTNGNAAGPRVVEDDEF